MTVPGGNRRDFPDVLHGAEAHGAEADVSFSTGEWGVGEGGKFF